jgi:hypothetical protein
MKEKKLKDGVVYKSSLNPEVSSIFIAGVRLRLAL